MSNVKKNYIGNICFDDEVSLRTICRWIRYDKDNSFNTVSYKLYNYLTQTECNIKGKVTISLSGCDDKNGIFVYNLHLDDLNRDLKVVLEEGDLIDHADELSIVDGNIERTYDAVNGELIKQCDTYYKDDNKYRRYYNPYGVAYNTVSGEDDVYVCINYPFNLINKVNPNESNGIKKPIVFIDEHEDKIKDYFSNLKFPIDLDEVLEFACEMSMLKGTTISDYPEIRIEVSKKTIEYSNGRKWYNREIKECIVMKNGQVIDKTTKNDINKGKRM